MQTYQDFMKSVDKAKFCLKAIGNHKASEAYQIAVDADKYDRQQNSTIMEYAQKLWTITGSEVVDFTAANNKITSNFFRMLNVQRNSYLLGNGVTFDTEGTKEKLGATFDTDLKNIGYRALIHGVCFGFWNVDRLHTFPITEFVPFWDEETGALMAGIRFWQIDTSKPLFFTLYEVDGYTKYRAISGIVEEIEPKRAYKQKVNVSVAYGNQVVGEENYPTLPIVPMYGSELKQSTLVGMKRSIDSYDLIRSGFANDITDCAQIYWIVKNSGGMDNADLNYFRDKLKFMHIATVDSDEGGGVEPFTQEIPYNARTVYLENIRHGIYEDFGALDVTSISGAAKTATEINAAYQPLDCVVDDYEYQVIEFVHKIITLAGLEGTPIFKRNRIANQESETQMVLAAGAYLDQESVLNHLPFISNDEALQILNRASTENFSGIQNLEKSEKDEQF